MTLDEAIKQAEEEVEVQLKNVSIWKNCNAVGEQRKQADRAAESCLKCAEEHRQLAEWLKELKKLREQTTWIPVSERTPEHPNPNPEFEGKPLDIYLVCKMDNIAFRAFWNGKIFTDGWTSLDVDAWMPLPKSYQGK